MICAYTGDDTGLLKKVRLGPTAPGALVRWGTQAAGGGVTCCSWGPPETGESFAGVGLDNGVVQFWRTSEVSESTRPAFEVSMPKKEGSSVESSAASSNAGIAALHAAGEGGNRVLSCDRRGCVRVYKWDGTANSAAQASKPAVPIASIEAGSRDGDGSEYSSYVAAIDPQGARVALGGREKDLVLWDVASASTCFKARNVPHDNLDLAVPVWVTGLQFVPSSDKQVAMCTGYFESRLRGEVRLYDVKSGQRRPTHRAIAPMMGGGPTAAAATGCEEAMRSLCVTPDARYVIVGSVGGQMARLDMRMNLKRLSGYKGCAGAVRQIACHPTLPLVACVSLDRHARVYDLEGKGEAVQKVYLKQRLSALLLSAERPKGVGGGEGEDADEGEEDVAAMLGALPEVEGGEARGGVAMDGGAAGFKVDARFGDGEEEDDDDDDDDGMDELDGPGGSSRGRGNRDEPEEEDVAVDEEDEADGEGVVAAMLRAKREAASGGGTKRKAAGANAEAPDHEGNSKKTKTKTKAKAKAKKKTRVVEVA